jgi:hypothetical protein
MSRMSLVLAVLVLVACHAASALEIREKRWGFDGRVRPNTFNLLSVFVANPDARNFDGQLVLEDRHGLDKPVGVPFVQPVFLSPGTQRWVQFHVFVMQAGGDWVLRWGKGARDQEKFDGAQFAAPARVLLIDPESPFAAAPGMRTFPEDLFPTTVAATDALDSVVCDHAPRWEGARREAFLDWLRRGGTVHLIQGADGQFPQFPEPLALLNTTDERTRIGAGIVARHAVARSQMTEQYLADHGFRAPELKTGQKVTIYNLDGQLLQKLAAVTKPRIAWWLIWLLAAGYLVCIGPMHYRWSKRMRWTFSIALLVALVAGFSAAFAYAGRRGASEKQQLNTLAIARSLGDGRYDVMQWASVFVTRGSLYKITHASPSNLYSTATEFESVNGVAVNARDGHLDVDIPLYSTRPFVHRGVLAGDRTEMEVAVWKSDRFNDLEALELAPAPGFPEKVMQLWVQKEDRFHELKKAGERWVLADERAKDSSGFFPDDYFYKVLRQPGPAFVRFGPGDDPDSREDRWREDAGRLLIARALGNVDGLQNKITRQPLPPDRLRVFIYAPIPDGFRLQDPRFKEQSGYVLYWQELDKP